MSQICKIIRDPANQVIQTLVLDSSSGNVIATAIVPRYFSGSGPPSPSTLANIFQYNKYDRYTDTTAVADYLCTFAGTNSTSNWQQISGSGGGVGIQKMWVTQDNGPTLSATKIPPDDYILVGASVSGGTGYAVGDSVPVPGGSPDTSQPNSQAVVSVSAIDQNGKPTAVLISIPGCYLSAPSTPQTLSSSTGSGAAFTLIFNKPIPVTVTKPPTLRTTYLQDVFLGVTWTYHYQPLNPTDGQFVYYAMTAVGTDGTSASFMVAPPYLYKSEIKVATLPDGSLEDLNTDARQWAELAPNT